MGCNFDVLIQVLYGSHWLTILYCGTKTTTGGFPIMPGAEKLFHRKKILANHGTQFKTISNKIDVPSLILNGLVIETLTREKTADETYEDDQGRERDETEEFLFYNIEEFTELLKFITREEKQIPVFFSLFIPSITRILSPVPMWCQMARSALPVDDEEIWMSIEQEEIDGVAKRLGAKQKELCALYRKQLVKIFTFILPNELARLIAEFSVPPEALDVRVAIRDCEEWTNGLIKQMKKHSQNANGCGRKGKSSI